MDKGKVKELHRIVRVGDVSATFSSQMECVLSQIEEINIGRTLRFVRFFISDAGNQMKVLSSAASALGCPVSIVQQPPLDGSKIAAWGYWTEGCELNPVYSHKIVCSLVSSSEGSLAQTEDIFAQYDSLLAGYGQSVASNCIRTWLFVRDVDVNYSGVVRGRKTYFDTVGLTADTHYIASTGIQGCTSDFQHLVLMDAYSVSGLLPGQMRFLYAPSHLNPTYEYGVTFERGVMVDYGDRRHLFISGTASIDNKGQILHEGDIVRQCERMVENISALLEEGEASLEDISVAILYLRDIGDYTVVLRLFAKRWPYLDPMIVLAPVCRPGWLVEMECIASREICRPEFPVF